MVPGTSEMRVDEKPQLYMVTGTTLIDGVGETIAIKVSGAPGMGKKAGKTTFIPGFWCPRNRKNPRETTFILGF